MGIPPLPALYCAISSHSRRRREPAAWRPRPEQRAGEDRGAGPNRAGAEIGWRPEATLRTCFVPEFPTQHALPHHSQRVRAESGPAPPTACPWPTPSHVPAGPDPEPRAPGPGRESRRRVGHGTDLGRLLPTRPRRPLPRLPTAWHIPDSLLMSLAGSRGAGAGAGTLRLALCSFQYSRQCRSWEWMKRHMSQAWAAHTSSSTQSLQRGRAAQGLGPQPRARTPEAWNPADSVAHQSPQPGRFPPPGGYRAPA